MADQSDDQDQYGGLAQDLLGKTGLIPAQNMGLGATLSGLLSAPNVPASPPSHHPPWPPFRQEEIMQR